MVGALFFFFWTFLKDTDKKILSTRMHHKKQYVCDYL